MPEHLTRAELISHFSTRHSWPIGAVARRLNCHVSSVYRWVYEGKVEAERLTPHKTYVVTRSLLAFLDKLQEAV